MILDEQDLKSPTWQKIKAWAESRVERHRRKNDRDLTPEETAKMRGRIAEANELLKLALPPQSEPEKD